MTALAKIAIFSQPPLNFAPPHHLSTASLRAGRKDRSHSIAIFASFFAIFLDSTKRIFPDLGVPYPLISTVGFAIFTIGLPRCCPDESLFLFSLFFSTRPNEYFQI
jgi:hypothetical protein